MQRKKIVMKILSSPILEDQVVETCPREDPQGINDFIVISKILIATANVMMFISKTNSFLTKFGLNKNLHFKLNTRMIAPYIFILNTKYKKTVIRFCNTH